MKLSLPDICGCTACGVKVCDGCIFSASVGDGKVRY